MLGKAVEGRHLELLREDLRTGPLAAYQKLTSNPSFCHVRCRMTPSMKQGVYNVYMLLGCEGEMATICAATCECAAG